jgi:flagellar motility protein MotE (MotC chaperone)
MAARGALAESPAQGTEVKGPEPRSADSGKRAGAKDENPPIPPSLTLHALCEELSWSGLDREEALKKLTAERESIKKERAELEKLAKEVAEAREQLKVETDRLVSFAELGEDAVKPGGEKFWTNRIAQVNADGGKSFDNLARTLKSMRPEGAAAVVAKLDRNLAAAVLQRLRPSDSSPILDRLKPEVAAELFGMIAADGAREARK